MLTMTGVPTSIQRSDMAALIAALGLDINEIPRNSTMRFGQNCVSVEVFARDLDGKVMLGPDDNAARHTVTIPIVD